MKRTNRRNATEARAQEHYEQYVKAAFGAACVVARKRGWSWTFEGDTVVVNTGEHVLVCSDRLDFAALVQEKR